MSEIFNLIISYVFIIFCGCLLLVLASSIGLIPLRLLNLQGGSLRLALLNSFWIGYTSLSSLLILLNIFLPISYLVLLILLLIAIASLIWNRSFLQKISLELSRKDLFYLVFIIFFALFFIRSNFSGHYAFDMYNYHFQLLRQAHEYPVIKGVINIFSHYANVYSTTYLTALLLPISFGKADLIAYTFFINSYLLSLGLFLSIFILIKKQLRQKPLTCSFSYKFQTSFLICSSIIFVLFPLSPSFAPTNGTEMLRNHIPDINFYLLSFVFILYFIFYLRESRRRELFVLMSLAVSLIFLKISSAALVLVLALSSFIFLRKTKRNIQTFTAFLAYNFLIMLPYFITTILKTGSIIFPISFTDLNLAWSNSSRIKGITEGVLSWARNPSLTESGVPWFGAWFNLYKKYFATMALLYSASFMLLFFKTLLSKYQRKESYQYLTVAICIWSPVFLFWFIMAPDLRFAGILFLIPLMVISSLICSNLKCYNTTIRKIRWDIILVLLIVGSLNTNRILFRRITLNKTISQEINLIPQKHTDGTIYFLGAWEYGYLCAYTAKQPCTPLAISPKYKFVEPSSWWKGIVKIDELSD